MDCTFGSSAYLWVEWFPNPSVKINVPFNFGDIISVGVSAYQSNYTINFINMSTPRGRLEAASSAPLRASGGFPSLHHRHPGPRD